MWRIRPRAIVESRITARAWFAISNSKAYFAPPVTFSRPSTRSIGLPTTFSAVIPSCCIVSDILDGSLRRAGGMVPNRKGQDWAREGNKSVPLPSPPRDMKVWFITGASKGFGRVWAEAALARGDKVAATGRDPRDLDGLVEKFGDLVLPLKLDVTDKAADFAAVKQAADHFGRLDVVVNNAGYGQFGAVEELSEEEARAQMETNLFGALWVTQAALPVLRGQGSGHVVQVSSIGGISAFPNVGMYHASKWALEGISQSLAQEVAPFGIKVTLIEPGGFSTDWGGPSAKHAALNPAYDGMREGMRERRKNMAVGDPDATGAVVLELVDMANPPLRVFFGTDPLGIAEKDYASRLDEWKAHQDMSRQAQG